MALPLLSIIVPTRDRPDLLNYALTSLAQQADDRIEVIVMDNPKSISAKPIFEKHCQNRWRYLRPSTPQSMCDNWEQGIEAAQGEHVAFMTDKMIFLPGALDYICSALLLENPDILNWWPEFFSYPNEQLENGYFTPAWQTGHPVSYQPQKALTTLVGMHCPTGMEGRRYYWGKICFGSYSASLISRIRRKYGRVFHEISPDFTSTIAALSLATSAIDLSTPLMMAFVLPTVSNGLLTSRSTSATERFYETVPNADELKAQLPFPELAISIHNSLARDYRNMRNRSAFDISKEVDSKRFALRVAQDLEHIFWNNSQDKEHARNSFLERLKELDLPDSLAPSGAAVTIVFSDQMEQHITETRAALASYSRQHSTITAAATLATKHYAPLQSELNVSPLKFDIRRVDYLRASAGLVVTALIDDLFTRKAFDIDAEAVVRSLARKGLPTNEPADNIDATDPLNFPLGSKLGMNAIIGHVIMSVLTQRNAGSLVTELKDLIDTGVLVISDLSTVSIGGELNREDPILEDATQRIRHGQPVEMWMDFLATYFKSDADIGIALYCLAHRTTGFSRDSLLTFNQKMNGHLTKSPMFGALETTLAQL